MFYEASRMQHCLAWMFFYRKKKEIIHLHSDKSLAL